MKINERDLEKREEWLSLGYALPSYDRKAVSEKTKKAPFWIHFGAGNIFRAFQAALVDNLLCEGKIDKGLIVCEGYDHEITEIDKACDGYHLLVTLNSDGRAEKRIIGSVIESLTLGKNEAEDERLREIFRLSSLEMASFTITEKGYSLTDGAGELTKAALHDIHSLPGEAIGYMGRIAALLYERFIAGAHPIAMVSMDNCSKNGDKLRSAILTFAKSWEEQGLCRSGFLAYVGDSSHVSFPCTMIDKITPRPDPSIVEMLHADGLSDIEPRKTAKGTYVAPFVNAERTEYLVVEDSFPNGKCVALSDVGVIFTDRETVERVERMKVSTCLNPLHTALAIFGCLLGYARISDEVRNDPLLHRLICGVGYEEGLPVVVNPAVINPRDFIDTVVNERLPNPFMPDTPERIATDTSEKLAIRFGETVKAYSSECGRIQKLKYIPLVYAGWLRYLMAIRDDGTAFEPSPDPMLKELMNALSNITLGNSANVENTVMPILKNKKIFGVDLYEVGIADKVVALFTSMTAGVGAVKATLSRELGSLS